MAIDIVLTGTATIAACGSCISGINHSCIGFDIGTRKMAKTYNKMASCGCVSE